MNSDIPEFDLQIDAAGKPHFVHGGQARAYLKRFAGQLISAQFYPVQAKRTSRQNRAYHAMVVPWLQCESRKGWSIDALKFWTLGEVFGRLEVIVPGTGEVVWFPAEPHTSKLTVAQFCELIDRTLELAAEDGVFLVAPDEYRRAKEAAARQAARKGKAA